MTKTCFKCHDELPITEFYRHKAMADGHLGKCKECTKMDVALRASNKREQVRAYDTARAQTPKRKAYQLENQRRSRQVNRQKWDARTAVGRAVKAGTLIPLPCEICDSKEVEAHHPDYAQPLAVRWLCFYHHRSHGHGQYLEEELRQEGI